MLIYVLIMILVAQNLSIQFTKDVEIRSLFLAAAVNCCFDWPAHRKLLAMKCD